MRTDYLLRVSSKPLVPYIMIFALYVQFHGDYGPGGGFQAGVIFAASVIVYSLIHGLRKATAVFTRRVLETLMATGVLLYGAVGVVAMTHGGNFLDYDFLTHEALHGQHLGILLVELGVGITVTAVMIGLFCLFAARGLETDADTDHTSV